MLDQLTANKFEKLVGSEVTVTVMNGPNLTLTLDSIRKGDFKCKDMPEGCRAQSFTLSLKGPGHREVPDGVYDLTFDKLGTVSGIYLDNKGPLASEKAATATSPDAAETDRVFYEVVFS